MGQYTCTVFDKYGRRLNISSPNNSEWFQRVYRGEIPYNYKNYLFYSPAYWNLYPRSRFHPTNWGVGGMGGIWGGGFGLAVNGGQGNRGGQNVGY